jgi:hypothetical protein
MSSAPRICTFQSDNAPERERWMACFYVSGKRLPIAFTAPAEEAVIFKADKFWADEMAKEAAKVQSAADRAEKRRAT